MTCLTPQHVSMPTAVQPWPVNADYVLIQGPPRKDLSRPLRLPSMLDTIASVALRSDKSGHTHFEEMGATTPHIRYISNNDKILIAHSCSLKN